MRSSTLLLAAVAVVLVAAPLIGGAAARKGSKIFPFPFHIDDLENGLRVITVPLPYPDMVAYWTVVRTGSRNEVEPGKSGFAHFFEHMMFRGTEKYPAEKYNEIMKVMGASENAFTSDDLTAYHILASKEDLETVMELEADRFRNLSYSKESFRTEAKAVLGEYNKNSANPTSKLFEVIREKSFTKHPYKHTTMGFLGDIEAMPEQFDYSLEFFDRFYRPENVVLLVVGDVDRDEVVAKARKYYGDWERGGHTQDIPVETEPAGPHTVTVDWPTPTLPWIFIGYRGPAFSTREPDMAALDLAAEVAFSESSPLYRKLVIEEQTVDELFTFFRDSRDPGLLIIGARVKEPRDVESVKSEILSTVEALRAEPVAERRLDAVKSNRRYAFALSMDNTESVASALAGFIHHDPTPETVNNLYGLYDRLTPEEIRRACEVYFSEHRRTVATLAREGALAAAETSGKNNEGSIVHVYRPSQVPLVSFRVLFNVGAVNDPEGKEGLAALTAAMLSRGGSRAMSYQEIVETMFPMATGVAAQVDKEMTVFSATTHLDNLEGFYGVFKDMILDPGWRKDDFERVKDDAINFLKVDLGRNNDEELGKEALYLFIYGPDHAYGHHNTGTLESLEGLSIDDVREFYKKHYTRANLTLGLAGGYPETFGVRLGADFSHLPAGSPSSVVVPEASPVKGQNLRIVRKDTRATAISLGFPIPVNRSHADWPALWLARSYFGQHRSSTSHLYQRIRELRGLNYGDYAYVEYFPRGMFRMQPDPNLGRQRQIFQIWIRPVEPANAHFALRIALYELRNLVERGLDEESFENTRRFLLKHAAVLARTQDAQLGYSLDGRYYENGEFVPWIRERLGSLTRAEVNEVIRRYLSWSDLKIVVVTREAEAFREAVLGNDPSPIEYNAPKPQELLEEDRVIQSYELSIAEGNAEIVDVEDVFKK